MPPGWFDCGYSVCVISGKFLVLIGSRSGQRPPMMISRDSIRAYCSPNSLLHMQALRVDVKLGDEAKHE